MQEGKEFFKRVEFDLAVSVDFFALPWNLPSAEFESGPSAEKRIRNTREVVTEAMLG
jgi:hypothetical protein